MLRRQKKKATLQFKVVLISQRLHFTQGLRTIQDKTKISSEKRCQLKVQDCFPTHFEPSVLSGAADCDTCQTKQKIETPSQVNLLAFNILVGLNKVGAKR